MGMQEVSEVAGVSRGTVYRHYPSRQHVLTAMAQYDERLFTEGLAAAVTSAGPAPVDRVNALTAYSVAYLEEHPARAMMRSDPDFFVEYLQGQLPAMRTLLCEHLGDVLAASPAVRAGGISVQQLADVLVRLFASNWILPEPDTDQLAATARGLLIASRGASKL
jgi:AcrR family transcriptional regulator